MGNTSKPYDWTTKYIEIKFIFIHILVTLELDLFTKSKIEDFDNLKYNDELSNNPSESNDNSSNSGQNDGDMDLDE